MYISSTPEAMTDAPQSSGLIIHSFTQPDPKKVARLRCDPRSVDVYMEVFGYLEMMDNPSIVDKSQL